jgi:hypothetical protein
MPEARRALDCKLLDRCGLKIEYIGKIVCFTIKSKDYSPCPSTQI